MSLSKVIRIVAAVAVLPAAAPVWATQHTGHQMGAPQTQPTPDAAVAECARVQPQVLLMIEAANARLEAARQSNSPTAMRAAMDDLQGTLGSLRAALAACAALQAQPTEEHAGHAMPGMQQPAAAAPGSPAVQPGSTPPPAATEPHAGHVMPEKPAAGAPARGGPHGGHAMPKPPAAAEKPPAKPPAPRAKEAPEDMTLPVMPAEEVMDPACPTVDKKTAPKASYQRKVYYFCSTRDRDEFKKDPAAYLTKHPRD